MSISIACCIIYLVGVPVWACLPYSFSSLLYINPTATYLFKTIESGWLKLILGVSELRSGFIVVTPKYIIKSKWYFDINVFCCCAIKNTHWDVQSIDFQPHCFIFVIHHLEFVHENTSIYFQRNTQVCMKFATKPILPWCEKYKIICHRIKVNISSSLTVNDLLIVEVECQ